MRCKRIPLEATVEKYELNKGMEDGFELWSDVVTKGWINTESLIKIKNENDEYVCPFIFHRRGRTFIGEDDYIVTDIDGTRQVCGEDKVFKRYEIID